MRYQATLEAAPGAVERVAHVAGWAAALPGVVHHEVEPQPDGAIDLILHVATPRQVRLRLALRALADGYAFSLIEGDVAEVRGSLTASDTQVCLDVDLRFTVTVPGALLRELQQCVLPRWQRSIAD